MSEAIDTPDMRPDSDAASSSAEGGEEEEGFVGVKDPFRRAMPRLEVEKDVCSICLDEFTEDDPGIPTKCGSVPVCYFTI